MADKRSHLIVHILWFIHRRRPKLVLLENVPGLFHAFPRVAGAVIKSLQSEGYRVTGRILDSSKYGSVPQHRKRLYIAAVREDV